MSDYSTGELKKKIENHENRIKKLEESLGEKPQLHARPTPEKEITLAELAKKDIVKDANGQQKVAAIVGYFEKVKQEGPSEPAKIKQGWKVGKFKGNFNRSFIQRGIGIWLRNNEDGTYDLSQDGEEFFKELID